MKLFLVFLLFLGFSAAQKGPYEAAQGSVRIMEVVEDGMFGVALSVPKGTHADRAIVRIGYHSPAPGLGLDQELFLVKVSAIEVIPEAWVMSDSIAVPREKIAWVDVQLVRDIEHQRFTMAASKE
jgi:hypothetical protein